MDRTIFVKYDLSEKIAYLVVYVDDIIITKDNKYKILRVKKVLAK